MKPNERLARHLKAATAVARESVVRGKDLTQRQREFLARVGCLIEIMNLNPAVEGAILNERAYF